MIDGTLVGDVGLGIRLLGNLPTFLRHRIGRETAQAILRQRFERRAADFLELMRRAVYRRPASPYRALLDLAGCEYGDLERLVYEDGLEQTLASLYQQGVYLSVDEFKGRRRVARGSSSFEVHPAQLRNPLLPAEVPAQSSGSRGLSTPVFLNLRSVRDRAVNTSVTLDARGASSWLHSSWVTPGAYVGTMLRHAAFGAHLSRWFSLVDPGAPGLHPRYRWSIRLLRFGASLSRLRLPQPTVVPYNQPSPILRWMTEALLIGQTPHLYTYVSAAVRLCQAALEDGLDLNGVQFTVTGEPLTKARLAIIERAGGRAVPDYGSIEAGGFISYGCLKPQQPDEVHLFTDLVALIQAGPRPNAAMLPASALLISSLRPTAPIVLLNVSLGDQAAVFRRDCECPLERLGWTTHLHSIRSFEKLTAGGMTFFDTDVIRVLEEVLPARFGGGPTDYQLVEEEVAETGRPRLRLLVAPTVGAVDEGAIRDAFLSAIGSGSGIERVMQLHWRDASLLSIERRTPYPAPSGKILHLVASPGLKAESPVR